MLIFDDNDRYKRLDKLDAGDLFRYQGKYYMKIRGESLRNAVELENGSLCLLTDDTGVEDLSGKYLQVMED